MRLIVGMSGATGVVLGVRLLATLKALGVETHLIMSRWAKATLALETDYQLKEVEALATVCYSEQDQAAAISSGSFLTDGMIIAPCSMKSVARIRHGLADDLLGRAADVILKERRKLVLLAREAPLSEIHLENMLALTRMGVVMLPPMLACYHRPESVEQLVDQIVARALDHFGLVMPDAQRWAGGSKALATASKTQPTNALNAAHPGPPDFAQTAIWPESLQLLFNGEELSAKASIAVVLITTDEDGWPRTSMVSVGELLAISASEFRLALWPNSRSAERLNTSGRVTLQIVHEGIFFELRAEVTALEHSSEPPLTCYALHPLTLRQQQADYADLEAGITFTLHQPDETLQRWQRQHLLLRRLKLP